MAEMGKVEYAKDNPYVSQVVTTASGKKIEIPQMVGSDTKVEPQKDGTYKVTTQGVVKPAPEPEVKILTEDELVAKYGKDVGNKLQTVA